MVYSWFERDDCTQKIAHALYKKSGAWNHYYEFSDLRAHCRLLFDAAYAYYIQQANQHFRSIRNVRGYPLYVYYNILRLFIKMRHLADKYNGLTKRKTKFSFGGNGAPSFLLKQSICVLSEPLNYFFNLSLNTVIFSNHCKYRRL